jgi:hypothetical protein
MHTKRATYPENSQSWHKGIGHKAVAGMVFLFLLASCQDNPVSFSDEPPELPPMESMEMDFSMFASGESQQKTGVADEHGRYSNFANAAGRVLIMKVAVGVNLVVPKILLKAAQDAEPEFNDQGEWVWSYSKTADDTLFEVRLVATSVNGNEVNWRLFVTNTENDLHDQLLFEGVTRKDEQSGRWTYYQLAGDGAGDPVSEIAWNIPQEDHAELRLDILSDRHGRQGDYIEYQSVPPVNRAYYYNAENDALTEIEWNTETGEGYLIAPGYNDGGKACWGPDYRNAACS